MSADEIVECMVNMYTVNAAININDLSFRDSTTVKYYEQLSKISGKSVTTIKQDFEKLLLMPDSMLVLQNRALDTLRAIQDRTINKTTINIGTVSYTHLDVYKRQINNLPCSSYRVRSV